MIFFRIRFISIVIFLFCPFSLFPAQATVYQYFDEDGTLIVTDDPYGLKKKAPRPQKAYKKTNLNFREDIAYEYYDVFGKNFHDLIASVKAHGPFDRKKNRRFAAQTKWSFGLSYSFESSYRIKDEYVYVNLNMSDVELISDLRVLLPMPPGDLLLSKQDAALWEYFMKELIDHEHDHVDMINDPAPRNRAFQKISGIKEIVLSIDSHEDINIDGEIRKAVEEETARIVREFAATIRRNNDEYDRITEHGKRSLETRGGTNK
jgi:predicted secreted Zn-dependent protease